MNVVQRSAANVREQRVHLLPSNGHRSRQRAVRLRAPERTVRRCEPRANLVELIANVGDRLLQR